MAAVTVVALCGSSGATLMHPGYVIEQVYLCAQAVDFRKSIDGLSALVEQSLSLNPFAAAVFVFVNRGRTKIKILYWHRNGFCLWYKRLEAQRFAWPVSTSRGVGAQNNLPNNGDHYSITAVQLQWLLEGFDLWQHAPHKSLQFTSTT
jgi:transposase